MFRNFEAGCTNYDSSEPDLETFSATQLEETIRHHVRVFEVLLCRSQEGILLLTPEMDCLRMVHAAIGHQAPEVLGLSALSFIHPGDAAAVRTAFDQLLTSQKQTAVCECRAKDVGGGWHWLELEMTDLLDDPDIGAILFNYRDITRRKKAEETARCLAAFLACPDYAMITLDRDGAILDWNTGAELALGYSADEMVGRNLSALIHPDSREREAAMLAKAAQGEKIPQYASTRIHRDGRPVEMRVSLSPISAGQEDALVEISHLAAPKHDSRPCDSPPISLPESNGGRCNG